MHDYIHNQHDSYDDGDFLNRKRDKIEVCTLEIDIDWPTAIVRDKI